MKPNTYKLVKMCVDTATAQGLRLAYKHNNNAPTKKQIEDQIRREVMSELCEWFEFEPKPETWEP